MTVVAFEDSPPLAETITEYDERHLITYIRMLDATAEGADWREIVQVIFGLDAEHDPERAKAVYDNHLSRATWMTQSGYRHLLQRQN